MEYKIGDKFIGLDSGNGYIISRMKTSYIVDLEVYNKDGMLIKKLLK